MAESHVQHKLLGMMKRRIPTVIAVVLLLAIWEAWVRLGHVPSTMIAAPSEIAQATVETWPTLWPATEVTLLEGTVGFLFAVTCGILLGILLFVIVVPLTRMDLRKGVFSGPNVANLGGAASLVPASYAPALLVATVAATVSLMGVGAFACVLLPLPLTVTGLMLLKGLVCACAGAVAGYITICYVVRSGKSEA